MNKKLLLIFMACVTTFLLQAAAPKAFRSDQPNCKKTATNIYRNCVQSHELHHLFTTGTPPNETDKRYFRVICGQEATVKAFKCAYRFMSDNGIINK